MIACISAAGPHAPGVGAADPPAAAEPTVVAILHPRDEEALDGGAALVQARCGDLPGVVLVERAEIDKVLAEQQLTAVLSAEAAVGRTALGRLLKADLLVILASARDKEGKIDPSGPVTLVICETARGLRLVVQEIQPIKGEAEVTAVTDLVRRAVDRRAKPITEIVAVPPFVSNDLDMEYQALQRPYAMVAEQILLEQPGVLVVELAEARAIADEQTLAGGDQVARNLPLFLLGEFRHDALAKAAADHVATLTVQLTISRGRAEIGRREIARVSRAKAASAIRTATAELLGKAAGTAGRAPDPKSDVKQLTDRANRMFRLGNWRESLELAEAALLLKGDDMELHLLALRSLESEFGRVLRSFEERKRAELTNLPPREQELLKQQRGQYTEAERNRLVQGQSPMLLRGRSHLEYVLRNKKLSTRDLFAGEEFMAGGWEPLLQMYMRVFRHKYERKVFDETAYLALQAVRVLGAGSTELSPEEKVRAALKAVEFLPVKSDSRGEQMVIMYLFTSSQQEAELRRRHAEACIPVLRGYENPACKAAADTLQRRLRANAPSLLTDAQIPRPVSAPNPARPERPEIRFERISIFGELSGWLRAGRGVDVFWDKQAMSLIRVERGRLVARPLAQIVGGVHGITPNTSVCFDGRHIWGFQNAGQILGLEGLDRPAEEPRLFAFDAAESRVRLVSARQGLPALSLSHVSLVAIDEGKICAIGHVTDGGRSRTWFGIVTLGAADDEASVNVFHESRDVAVAAGGKAADRSSPISYAYLAAEPGGRTRRVIANVGEVFAFDPDKPKVELPGFEIRTMVGTDVDVTDGTLRWVWNTKREEYHVFSLGHDDKKPRSSSFAVPWGNLTRWGDRWVMVDRGMKFHATDDIDKPFRPLVTDLPTGDGKSPWTQGLYLFHSHHFGLVMHDLMGRKSFRVVDATTDPPGVTFPPGRSVNPSEDVGPPPGP